MADAQIDIFEFSITGLALKTLLKQLRPAFPKKADWPKTLAVIQVRPNHVAFGLPGAQVGGAAVATKSFRVEIPFSELQFLREEPFKPSALVHFSFEQQRMTVGAISTGHDRIHVSATT